MCKSIIPIKAYNITKMASQKTSSGYNNPAYCSQHDYGQLVREALPGAMNHGNVMYIAATAVDNYCYEDDDEMQISATAIRQQTRQLVREPPIGASATLKVSETSVDNMSLRTALPMSPKRNHCNGRAVDSPGSGHRNETMITSPRTPNKNSSFIVTPAPRNSHAGASMSPHRAITPSPKRQQVCGQKQRRVNPVCTPRKAILSASPTKSAARNAKYVLPSQHSTATSHRSTAVISPMYAHNTPTASAVPLVTQKHEPFLATGVVCRKSPARMDASPVLRASWIRAPTPYQAPPTCTISTAAGTLLLCGAVSIVLCLYMISKVRTQIQAYTQSDNYIMRLILF